MSGPPQLPASLGTVASQRRLGGGDIGEAWRVRTEDGRDLVVKRTPYDADLEAEGLRALADVGAPVPRVHHVAPDLLVMDHVGGPPDWRGLGARLAAAHDPDRVAGAGFGWHRDNLLGTVPQANTPADDWGTFFVAARVRAHLADPALPRSLAERLDRACDDPLPELLDHGARPSLVHGDLWPGNVVAGRWLVDPAVHRADAESDLAAAMLFGGVPRGFLDGYREVRPLDPGWEERLPVLQLHHLLAHVRMFGTGWAGAVEARLDARGW